jgi:hypothetical protein
MLIEIIRNPDLYRAVQEEISQTVIKGSTCSEYLDYTKLASSPLIQSIYTEVLRLHVQILVTRTSIESVKVAGYELPKGSVLQAPTAVPHLDEEICVYILANYHHAILSPWQNSDDIVSIHETKPHTLRLYHVFEPTKNISANFLNYRGNTRTPSSRVLGISPCGAKRSS